MELGLAYAKQNDIDKGAVKQNLYSLHIVWLIPGMTRRYKLKIHAAAPTAQKKSTVLVSEWVSRV